MEWLEFGCILHRALQCDDEAATDDELLAHVLWYHPAADTTKQRLCRLSLVEGLVAFAGSVSGGEKSCPSRAAPCGRGHASASARRRSSS